MIRYRLKPRPDQDERPPVRVSTPDTPEAEAAIAFILAVDGGEVPDGATLRAVRDIVMTLLTGGTSAEDMFGLNKNWRPRCEGFRPADIVSAFVERRRRELGGKLGATTHAVGEAIAAFEFTGDAKVARRKVERYRQEGRHTVECLTDEDLDALLALHCAPPPKTHTKG